MRATLTTGARTAEGPRPPVPGSRAGGVRVVARPCLMTLPLISTRRGRCSVKLCACNAELRMQRLTPERLLATPRVPVEETPRHESRTVLGPE